MCVLNTAHVYSYIRPPRSWDVRAISTALTKTNHFPLWLEKVQTLFWNWTRGCCIPSLAVTGQLHTKQPTMHALYMVHDTCILCMCDSYLHV